MSRSPVGYVSLGKPSRQWIKDPDPAVQQAIMDVFTLYERLRSLRRVAVHLSNAGVLVPANRRTGAGVTWRPALASSVHRIVANPHYAGYYRWGKKQASLLFGRVERGKNRGRAKLRSVPREQWRVIDNHHEPYVEPDRFWRMRSVLEGSSLRRQQPPLRGAALVQGLAWCGDCDRRMYTFYWKTRGRIVANPPGAPAGWTRSRRARRRRRPARDAARGPNADRLRPLEQVERGRLGFGVVRFLLPLDPATPPDACPAEGRVLEREPRQRVEHIERIRAEEVVAADLRAGPGRTGALSTLTFGPRPSISLLARRSAAAGPGESRRRQSAPASEDVRRKCALARTRRTHGRRKGTVWAQSGRRKHQGLTACGRKPLIHRPSIGCGGWI